MNLVCFVENQDDLTLTSVVFESKTKNEAVAKEHHLTLTSVVFELASV